ncbi:RHS repeat-associated core domain-containing protein [Nitrogeniibacter aestuarii]|uniref:RHS repeat-associated core domain-containing protein n=1 Tax=Nitrogeniibacter aestuarii TaxID=2815343 RepID=UPI001D128CA9|nr:RHS repeat-associated core domain-containing protein [Nitrogeniibacter aestuarii]
MTEGADLPHALTGISEVDSTGQTIRYARYGYDASGKATLTSHASGEIDRYTFDYTQPNAETIVTDPLGAPRKKTFVNMDGVVRMTSQSKPAGAGCEASTSSLDYDPNGNVTTRTQFDGTQTTYDYDLIRNLETTRIEAAGTPEARATATEWHPDWHLKTRVAEPKLITTWVYNGQQDPIHGGTAACAPADAEVIAGMPIAVVCSKTEQPTTDGTGTQGFSASVDGPARTWTYTYNRYGKVLTADGPRTDVADVWTYEYFPADALCPGEGEGIGMDKGCRGELMRATDPVGLVTEYLKYNAHGQILEMVAPNGVLTRYTYDLRQRMTSQQVGSLLTVFDYDPRGLLERVTLAEGSAIAYAYDDAHRLTGITQVATGERIEYTLDNAGNRTAETVFDAQGQVARQLAREFDALGRLWREIRSINGQSAATDYLHDAEDRLTHEINPLSETRQWQYNALGNLKAEIDALNATTQIVPDANGQAEAVIAANGAKTSFQVNGLGQVLFEGSPDRGNITYNYDDAGNLVSRTFASGITEVRTYDAASRPESIRYVKGATTYWRQFDYQWNPRGQLEWLNAAGGNMKYEYDALGRVTRNLFNVMGPGMDVRYAYDNAGRVSRITYPSGRQLDIGYDTAGRIDNLAMAPYQLVSGVIYHPFGPVRQMTLLNGLVHTRELDANGLPSRITLGGVATDYGYDLAGRITTLDDTSGSPYDQSFGYDAAGRITGYNGHPGPRGYTYDANGNRTSDTIAGMVTSIVMRNNSNRIYTIGGKSVTYAADGAVRKYDGLDLYYNVEVKLQNVVRSDGRVNYVYDGLGRRVGKVNYGTSALPYNIKYAYDLDNHLIGEYQQDGTPIREYVWLGDLIVAVIDTNPDGSTTAYAVETDHLGTPRLLTDATQQARWRWTSPPFGDLAPAEDPSGLGKVTFNLRFPGQYYDRESGLFYNWNRFYHAGTGRYLQSDPIGLDGGWNTYGYVGGDPLGYADPRGLAVWGVNVGIGGTALGKGSYSYQLVFDSEGNFGIQKTWEIGYGVGVGAGAFATLFGGSADNMFLLAGPGISNSGSVSVVAGALNFPIGYEEGDLCERSGVTRLSSPGVVGEIGIALPLLPGAEIGQTYTNTSTVWSTPFLGNIGRGISRGLFYLLN